MAGPNWITNLAPHTAFMPESILLLLIWRLLLPSFAHPAVQAEHVELPKNLPWLLMYQERLVLANSNAYFGHEKA